MMKGNQEMNDHDHASCSGYDADGFPMKDSLPDKGFPWATSQDVCKDCPRRCPRDIQMIDSLQRAIKVMQEMLGLKGLDKEVEAALGMEFY